MSEAARSERPRSKDDGQRMLVDTELEHLPPELRWREWMGRVEAVIFAASEPVPREVLARVVGKSCNLDLVIDDIRVDLRPSVRAGVCRRRLAAPHQKGFWRRHPRRLRDSRGAGDKRTVAVGVGRAHVYCLFPADHTRRAVFLLSARRCRAI
jgi:hypothetical protein